MGRDLAFPFETSADYGIKIVELRRPPQNLPNTLGDSDEFRRVTSPARLFVDI